MEPKVGSSERGGARQVSSHDVYDGTFSADLYRPYECSNPDCQATTPTFTEGNVPRGSSL